MSQAAYDQLQAALKEIRFAEQHDAEQRRAQVDLLDKLVAQAMCVVLNARPVFQSSKIEVDRDDVEELRKVLIEMGVDLSA